MAFLRCQSNCLGESDSQANEISLQFDRTTFVSKYLVSLFMLVIVGQFKSLLIWYITYQYNNLSPWVRFFVSFDSVWSTSSTCSQKNNVLKISLPTASNCYSDVNKLERNHYCWNKIYCFSVHYQVIRCIVVSFICRSQDV